MYLFSPCMFPGPASVHPRPLQGPAAHPHVPLTSENLLQKVPGESWKLIRQLIHDDIFDCFDYDENGVVSWFVNAGGVSWRNIVHTLDRMNEIGIADTMRGFLEPPTGTVLHVVCRCKIFQLSKQHPQLSVKVEKSHISQD